MPVSRKSKKTFSKKSKKNKRSKKIQKHIRKFSGGAHFFTPIFIEELSVYECPECKGRGTEPNNISHLYDCINKNQTGIYTKKYNNLKEPFNVNIIHINDKESLYECPECKGRGTKPNNISHLYTCTNKNKKGIYINSQ